MANDSTTTGQPDDGESGDRFDLFGAVGQTGYVIVPTWIIPLGSSAVLVYLALGTFANNTTRKAWPNHETIAEVAGVSVSTVRAGLRRLEAHGAVRIFPRFRADGSQRSNGYWLPIDPPDVVSDPPPGLLSAPPTPPADRCQPADRGGVSQQTGGVSASRQPKELDEGELDVSPDGLTPQDDRPDVSMLCDLLASQVEQTTGVRPVVSKAWRRDMRLTLDAKRGVDSPPWTSEQVEYVIRWLGREGDRSQFWSMNVRCPGKLRSKMQRLVDEIKDERRGSSQASRTERLRNLDPASIPSGNPFARALAAARDGRELPS